MTDETLLFSRLGGLMAPVTCMSLTSNDAFLIVSCEDETVRVFSLCSGTELHELRGHESKAHSLVVGEDDCQVTYFLICNLTTFIIHTLPEWCFRCSLVVQMATFTAMTCTLEKF